MRIAVTCGYSKSLHAITLIHRLVAQGHKVVLCLNVRLFNIARLRFYLRQIGLSKLLLKIQDRLLGGKLCSEEIKPLLDYMRENGIPSRTVSEACKTVHTRLVNVPSLDSSKALKALQEAKADLVVYAGGGILRKQFIQTPKLGVLNAHGGPLPQFRGMNASEWALFYGVKPNVTIHYIDRGIDTGPIFFSKPIPNSALTSISNLRGHGTRVGVESLVEAVKDISEGRIKPVAQDINSGKQFFVMAEPLLELLQRWLNDGAIPLTDSKNFRWPNN